MGVNIKSGNKITIAMYEGSNISECIKLLMALKHISIDEMSTLTGISKLWIQDYMDGKRVPRGYHLLKVAKALDVTESYLLEQCKNKKGKIIV